jgi:hypothetical protein
MKLEITPEPAPEEREALEHAFGQLLDEGRPGARSAWWRAGVEESLSPGEEPA